MKYTQFHENRFHQQVNSALISVKRILDTTRNPRLAHEDQDHQYEDKFALAALLTNTALVSHMTVLERLGVTSDHLETMGAWVHNEKESVTMRFEAIQTCKFLQEKEVPFVQGSTYTQETERSGRFFGKSHDKKEVKTKVTTMVKEYHWKVRVNYKLIVFAGASPEGDAAKTITLQTRDASTTLFIKGTEKVPFLNVFKHDPIDVDMTWFLQQISPQKKICKFVIDRSDAEKCKTPRRNEQVDQAIAAFRDLVGFADRLRHFLCYKIEKEIVGRHAPAAPTPSKDGTKKSTLMSVNANALYNPILPLMERNTTGEEGPTPNALVTLSSMDDEESPLLSMADMDKFLGEQIRTLDQATTSIRDGFPSAAETHDSLVSTAEAKLVLMCCHLVQLGRQYEDSVDYIENMLKKQLVAAIGKEVKAEDFDQFMSFYYRNKFYEETYAPNPFCFAIRRPGYYPDGILSIEKSEDWARTGSKAEKMEPVETFTHRIPAADSNPPIRVPLNAATTVQLTGDRYLHGWMQYRFSGMNNNKSYRLGARARQFSCFLVMVGTMAGPDKFEPKDAIILQNKDEVLIPLLLDELPTAKEFKDAISSMSPEQQQFAKAFREMQLESSVFGVCVVQLKPQLEDLLGLPPGGLTKEMQLTQDLLSLFIDYQIPSDMLSYDGPSEEEDRTKKIALVKEYTKSVLDVIKGEKEKQLELEKEKAKMAIQKEIQEEPHLVDIRLASAPMYMSEEAESAVEGKRRSRTKKASARASMPESGSLAYSSLLSGAPVEPGCDWARAPPAQAVPGPEGGPFDGPGIPGGPSMGPGIPERPSSGPRDGGGAALKSTGEPRVPVRHQPEETQSTPNPEGAIDFTKIPKQLDAQFENHDRDNSLRATIIKTGPGWTRLRQESLLSKAELKSMQEDDIRSERDKAFDLLDALSRSGSLPLRHSELHVVVAVTHCFENDVVGTVIQDNINPIEKVEKSSLLMASTIHGSALQAMLQNPSHVHRLKGSFPALFDG